MRNKKGTRFFVPSLAPVPEAGIQGNSAPATLFDVVESIQTTEDLCLLKKFAQKEPKMFLEQYAEGDEGVGNTRNRVVAACILTYDEDLKDKIFKTLAALDEKLRMEYQSQSTSLAGA